jgi:pimeloyl-ACP methyl ester carboxylesterase
MSMRWQFVMPHVAARFPAVRWNVAAESEVRERHGARLHDLASAFAPPASFAPERSASVPGRRGSASWLRYPAPVEAVGDTAWARVIVPEREHAPRRHPVVVFTHGIAMETEFWRGQSAPPKLFAERNVAMIRPEGPFHGRRRVAGCYGGEPVIARGPMGLLDYFHSHVIELGLLVAWARATFGGPVALGGVSLGALTAQRAAVAARNWPAEMRPDALLLVTPSASIAAAALGGSLPRAAGVPAALAAAGWTEAGFERWSPLIEGGGAPEVAPERIVVTLGTTDDITPYAEGERLIRDWHVPGENVFRRKLGHFSTSLALLRDSAPLLRLADVLDAIS